MRKIKFRGKEIATGSWVYGNLLVGTDIDGCREVKIENTEFDKFRQWLVDPETVGQLTGLVDKNEVEIYEGDIVEFLYKHPESAETLKPVQCEIFWSEEGAWCLKWFDKNRYENKARLSPEKYTVVGNIYENEIVSGD